MVGPSLGRCSQPPKEWAPLNRFPHKLVWVNIELLQQHGIKYDPSCWDAKEDVCMYQVRAL